MNHRPVLAAAVAVISLFFEYMLSDPRNLHHDPFEKQMPSRA